MDARDCGIANARAQLRSHFYEKFAFSKQLEGKKINMHQTFQLKHLQVAVVNFHKYFFALENAARLTQSNFS